MTAPADRWLAEAMATRDLDRVQPNMAAAGERVNDARRHLRSARLLADDDRRPPSRHAAAGGLSHSVRLIDWRAERRCAGMMRSDHGSRVVHGAVAALGAAVGKSGGLQNAHPNRFQ